MSKPSNFDRAQNLRLTRLVPGLSVTAQALDAIELSLSEAAFRFGVTEREVIVKLGERYGQTLK